jgi:AraC-like DNA-binding protein
VCPLVVETSEMNSRVEESRAERDRQLCLAAIGSSIHECQYKKSLETAKEYIDFLFRSNENINIIRGRTVEFITGLTALGEGHSPEAQQRLNAGLERFRLRFDLQSSAFEVAGVADEMLNVIFTELESRQLYSGDDLKKVLNYIDRNIKRGVTLDMAAAYVGMSASYFSKFFKKYMGVNFITYVTDRKIEAAKDMLVNTDRPVVNIAYDLSYSETNYFSKTFKKKVGVTPTEYRERHLNAQGAKVGS